MLVVQHIQVPHHVPVLHLIAAERHGLVENGQCVAHRPVSLPRYDVQGLIIYVYPFFSGNSPEIPHDIRNAYPVEIISLAPRQDGRENLVFLGGGEDENRVGRRLLEGLEERVERSLAQHVDLVDDIDAVTSHLGRNLDLVDKCLDVIHAVVGGGVELVYAI